MHRVHSIDLLESLALTFDEEEVNDNRGEKATTGEDISIPEVDGRRDERGKESDQEVPKPVRGGRDGHAFRPIT